MQTQAQSIRWWSRCRRWRAAAFAPRALFAVALLAGVSLAACTMPPVVRTNYDQGVDFAQYRTYGFWESPSTNNSTGYESLTTQQLKAATRREMDARGYTYSAHDAELLVNFGTKVEQRTRVHSYPGGYGYPGWYGWYGWGYPGWGAWGGWEPYIDQYDEGTLTIDIVDASRRQLVWQGSAVTRISDKMRDNQSQALSEAVREIFMKYPFRAGGG